jgi:deoxyribodipyrimidine photo-lyase
MFARILIWYRHDLRLHDHEPLFRALQTDGLIFPFYCFDNRQLGYTSFGFPKTGRYRTLFLLESLAELKRSLQQLGSDLIIRQGLPEQVIPAIAQALKIDAVYYYGLTGTEEAAVERSLHANLAALRIKSQRFWGHTLYPPDQLPFPIKELPELFTRFRQQLEAHHAQNPTLIPAPFPPPGQLPPLPPFSEEVPLGQLPELDTLVQTSPWASPTPHPPGLMQFRGGEAQGLQQVQAYLWQGDRLRHYKQTRNGMLRPEDSTKLSPWLALGCLSPRYLYQQIQEYESQRVKNDSTYWLVFELLWRDYFGFVGAKYGNRLFYRSGLRGIQLPWKEDQHLFAKWQQGQTGFPLVDANMRELAATGFMANRGRQNVASFLTKNLGMNWQMGAEWFESLLIDYDVCSNWGNWNYTAGIGNDARGFRFFNIIKQSKDYDSQGEYVKYWLPELTNVPPTKIHEPWKLSTMEQKRYGVQLGVSYPQPIVDLFASAQANELLYQQVIL